MSYPGESKVAGDWSLDRDASAPSETPSAALAMDLSIDLEPEDDGRWVAAIPELPGVIVYGLDRDDAIRKAGALALRTLADRVERGDAPAESLSVSFCLGE